MKNKWITKIKLLQACVVLKTIIIEIIKNIDDSYHDNISSSNDNNKNDDNSNLLDENNVKS